ncbi:hypothetical protein WOLCODRAFT_167398 [Wolfiporia cocos MD-104 SS10]|uniref:Uncharacterized protein n=1 Tax=Wolfiporia cocos (strain MD-104) TaxID=742152 RepID=A0A2H3J6F2_WOLCO|nr:hypothetical protein WOLCODRAFT_167398 [Wolfiporia cocos MD-104 SS10]
MLDVAGVGPILIVAGGFYDGKSVTVEPLTRPCLMMEDDTGKRQQELARVLYASFDAVRAFRGLLETPLSTTYAFGTPRVYPSFCRLDTGRETLLQFEERLIPVDTSHHLLFSGKCRDPSTLTWDKVAVKLVMNYGSEVHRFLAGHNLAPILYGSVAAVGAPTAYVMSLLGKEWVTLLDYRSRLPSDASTFTNAITAGLNKVLEVLESKDYVHGDLRDNNIMILVDAERHPVLDAGQAQLRVIDFNWAGNAGEVQYPAQRNDSIEGWPGRAGDLIKAGHDRQLTPISPPVARTNMDADPGGSLKLLSWANVGLAFSFIVFDGIISVTFVGSARASGAAHKCDLVATAREQLRPW